MKIFGYFQANKAGSCHDGALDFSGLDGVSQSDGIVRGSHVKDIFQMNALHRRNDRGSTGGNDLFIVRILFGLTGLVVQCGDGFGLTV